jgi:hypothetical protein
MKNKKEAIWDHFSHFYPSQFSERLLEIITQTKRAQGQKITQTAHHAAQNHAD